MVTGVLSHGECNSLLTELSSEPRTRAGIRHLMSNSAVSALANQPGPVDLATEWLGGRAIPFRATLFEKSWSSNWLIPWHQDTAIPLERRFDVPGWGSWSEKAGVTYAHAPGWALARIVALRVHLDASGAENGPLRVIPGSHTYGVLSDEAVAEFAARSSAIECRVPRGGVLAMRPLLIHASSKAQTDKSRRVLHIEYADSLDLADGIRLAVV